MSANEEQQKIINLEPNSDNEEELEDEEKEAKIIIKQPPEPKKKVLSMKQLEQRRNAGKRSKMRKAEVEEAYSNALDEIDVLKKELNKYKTSEGVLEKYNKQLLEKMSSVSKTPSVQRQPEQRQPEQRQPEQRQPEQRQESALERRRRLKSEMFSKR